MSFCSRYESNWFKTGLMDSSSSRYSSGIIVRRFYESFGKQEQLEFGLVDCSVQVRTQFYRSPFDLHANFKLLSSSVLYVSGQLFIFRHDASVIDPALKPLV